MVGAGSLGGSGNRLRRSKPPSVEAGGVHLPALSTEIALPQDAKLSALAPEPSELREIMKPTSEADAAQDHVPYPGIGSNCVTHVY